MRAHAHSGPLAIHSWGTVLPEGDEIVTVPDPAAPAGVAVRSCPVKPSEEGLPVAKLRRLGRAQRLALAAVWRAKAAAGDARLAGDQLAVSVGTGLGELGQTTAFVENLILHDEAQPRPACFINSVHNSVAGQIGLLLGARGENHTFTHGLISFELAVWQARQTILAGRAEQVIACGVDELNPYLLLAGRRFGWWREGDWPASELLYGASRHGTRPGEGAGCLVLGRPDPKAGHVHLLDVRAETVLESTQGPQAEAGFVESSLRGAGLDWQDVDIVIVGSNGDAGNAAEYRTALQAMERRCGRALPAATYKGATGDYATAAAVGAALAAESVAQAAPAEPLRVSTECPTPEIRHALLYHRYPTGHRSVLLVGR